MSIEEKVKTERIAFGWKQITERTPEVARIAFRIILYFCAIVSLAMNVFTDIPENIKSDVNKYALQVVAFIHLISRFFGVKSEEFKEK